MTKIISIDTKRDLAKLKQTASEGKRKASKEQKVANFRQQTLELEKYEHQLKILPGKYNAIDLVDIPELGKATKFALTVSNLPHNVEWRGLREMCNLHGNCTFAMCSVEKNEGFITFSTRQDMINAYNGLKDKSVFGCKLELTYCDPDLTKSEKSHGRSRSPSPPPKPERSEYSHIVKLMERLEDPRQRELRSRTFAGCRDITNLMLLDYFLERLGTDNKIPIKTGIPKTALWKPDMQSKKGKHRAFFSFGGKTYGNGVYYRNEAEAKEETARLCLIDVGIVPSSKTTNDIIFDDSPKPAEELLDAELDEMELGYFGNENDISGQDEVDKMS